MMIIWLVMVNIILTTLTTDSIDIWYQYDLRQNGPEMQITSESSIRFDAIRFDSIVDGFFYKLFICNKICISDRKTL